MTQLGKLEIPQVPEMGRQGYRKTDGARYLNKKLCAHQLPWSALQLWGLTAVERQQDCRAQAEELQTPKTGDSRLLSQLNTHTAV